jgi:ribonuclease HI
MSKLIWECKQAIYALSNTNKVTCLWVPGNSGIQGNQVTDTLAKKGSSNPFLGSEPAIPISQCVGTLKIKEWMTRKHSKYTTATLV